MEEVTAPTAVPIFLGPFDIAFNYSVQIGIKVDAIITIGSTLR